MHSLKNLSACASRARISQVRSEHGSMKLALIALGLLATTGVVYAACVFC
jgi:hypothetical protein